MKYLEYKTRILKYLAYIIGQSLKTNVCIVKKNILLFIALGLILSACQHQIEQSEKSNKVDSQKRKEEAAALNTQLGMGYLKQGDRARAKRKLLYALELAPKSASANAAMAYFMEQSGDNSKADGYYQKALSYSGNSGAQLNNYGTYLCRQGKYQEAEQYFLKAVKDTNYLNTSGAYENAGLCAQAIPDYAKAKMYFKKALEQDPERKQSLYELIAIAKKEQDTKGVLDYFEHHPTLVYNDPSLLREAMEFARKEQKDQLVDFYQKRLLTLNQFATNKFGAKDDHNNG